MTDYSTQLRNSIGRRYGEYDACVKGMDKKFENEELYSRKYSRTDEGGSVSENVRYFDKNNNIEIAQAFCRKFNDGTGQYEILDFSCHAQYDYTGGRLGQFNQFTQRFKNGAIIEFNDTKGNDKEREVDEDDLVRINENGKWSQLISIKDLLSGKQPIFEED